MTNDSTKSSISQPASDTTVYLFDDWFDPIEAGVRDRVRGFIEAMIEEELETALARRATDASLGRRWRMTRRLSPATGTGGEYAR